MYINFPTGTRVWVADYGYHVQGAVSVCCSDQNSARRFIALVRRSLAAMDFGASFDIGRFYLRDGHLWLVERYAGEAAFYTGLVVGRMIGRKGRNVRKRNVRSRA